MSEESNNHELKHMKWAAFIVLITSGLVGAMWGWAFTAIDRQGSRLNSVENRLVRIETIVELVDRKLDLVVSQRREEERAPK